MGLRRNRKRGGRKSPSSVRRSTLSPNDLEDVRLALLGVYATCDLVRAASMSYCVEVALTRGALQPLRKALERLGYEHTERLYWPTGERP